MLRWLKNRMPRSLYARALLILLLPVLTLQLVISVSFIQRHFEGVTEQMTRSVLLELRYLTDVVSRERDPQAAQALAATVADPLGLAVLIPAPEVPQSDGIRLYDFTAGTVAELLNSGVPGASAVRFEGSRRVNVWINVPAGPMQVSFDRARVSASNPHQLIVLMLVLGALLVGVAFLFLRNQLRPIKRMATAATAFGKGRMVPYSPSGATEVRVAGMAFLEMRARIERQTMQRTLMLSGVSHDLRTPLTRLKLGLSMIDGAEAEHLLADVAEMESLIDGFLDFAKGDAEDAMTDVDLLPFVEGIVADARRGGLAVELAPMEGGASFDGLVAMRDKAIRRAIMNLLGNARRYGNRAVVTLSIGERSWRVSVEDDGPGIPADQREEAVRPFTRLDPARNQDRGSGVGLGLAIVADIARTHGGVLRLGSSEALGGLRADLVIAR